MAKGYEMARLDDLEALPVVDGAITWRPVRRRLGIEAFGVNVFSADDEGRQVIEDHHEPDGHEELYLVLRGRAAFTLADGDEVDAPPGTLVFVRPGTRRAAVAREPGTAVLAVGAKRDEVFRPSGWEYSAVAFARLDAGRVEEGRRLMLEGIAADESHWAGPYNLACFEARAGRPDDAIAALRRSIELDPEESRKWAEQDIDFESLRGDPRFESAVAGKPETGSAGL